MRRRNVTIGDIAQRSNASITTVSMVLRDKPGISAATRDRVLKVAQELGYERRSSITVPGVRTLNVAMIVRAQSRDDAVPSLNPFYSWVVTGIETAARGDHFNLLYATVQVDGLNRPVSLPEHLLGQSLSGVLLIGAFSADTVAQVAAARTAPTVLVDGAAETRARDAIVSDNEGGAYAATRHLIARGHRQIALVGPLPEANPNFTQRRAGYERALAERGLPPSYIATDQFAMYDVRPAIAGAFRGSPGITAIFACNDELAVGTIRALQNLGRKVPEDVSVVGFDDIALADQVTPRLTTMAVDKIGMGRLAVLMLSHRLAWPEGAPVQVTLQPNLRERESVRALTTTAQRRTQREVVASSIAAGSGNLGSTTGVTDDG